jgi:hypothetical protein
MKLGIHVVDMMKTCTQIFNSKFNFRKGYKINKSERKITN